MNKVIKLAFFNGKGGCGKSTGVFNVSSILADKGYKVLVIDLDKQRNATDTFLAESEIVAVNTVFDVLSGSDFETAVNTAYIRKRGNANPKPIGVDVLCGSVQLENDEFIKSVDVEAIEERYDEFIKESGYTAVIVDMPPSSKSITHLAFSAFVDYVVAPFSSDNFSVNGYGDVLNSVEVEREYNSELSFLGVYLSRYAKNCGLDKFLRANLKENFKKDFIDVQIPLSTAVRESTVFSRPMIYYKQSAAATSEYLALTEEIIRRINTIENNK